MANMKTVSIRPETKERLAKFGKFGQTIDELLNELMDEVEKYRKKYQH